MTLLTRPEGPGGPGGLGAVRRAADEGVVDGANGDAVLLHLGPQAVEERLDGMFRGGVWIGLKHTVSSGQSTV